MAALAPPSEALLSRQAHALAAGLLAPEELDSVRGCQEQALAQAQRLVTEAGAAARPPPAGLSLLL